LGFSPSRLRAQVFGDYFAGALVEISEPGGAARYAFGIEDGTSLNVRRVAVRARAASAQHRAWPGGAGDSHPSRGQHALFEQRVNEVWTSVHTAGLPAGSAGAKAGLFLASDTRQRIKAAFDYAILIDPPPPPICVRTCASRKSYNPAGGGDYEFVELINIGIQR
jgi:hypothetical protein